MSFIAPFRRILQAGPTYARFVATDARASLSAGPPTAQAIESTRVLTNLVSTMAEQHDYEKKAGEGVKPIHVYFAEQTFLRPAHLHRSHLERIKYKRRSAVGPGREARYGDIFMQLGIDPRREADNRNLMGDYASGMSRVQPRTVTGLTQRSQRLLGKAIKRAKMMGVIPLHSNWNSNDVARDTRSSR